MYYRSTIQMVADGKVYENVNMESLGTIYDTPYSLIYREFTEGKSWLNIRDQKPCTDCIYQWLCPSPSNYEILIGKSNLCHVEV
jgi:pseudo-rSAM protein